MRRHPTAAGVAHTFCRPVSMLAGVAIVLGVLFARDVGAEPPPGHPSPSDAMRLMQPNAPAADVAAYTGVVLDAIDANEFTYIETDVGGRVFWIATARLAIKRGELIRFEEGVTMDDFHSRLLDRTFPSVMFVRQVSPQATR